MAVATMSLLAAVGIGTGTSQAAVKRTFSLRVTPSPISLPAGQQALVQVAIGRSGGFRSTVRLSMNGVPAGVSVATVSTSSTRVTFMLTASQAVANAQSVVTVVGRSSSLVGQATFKLQTGCTCAGSPPIVVNPPVTAPPVTASPTTVAPAPVGDYSVTIDPTQATLSAGDSIRYAVFVNGSGGFSSTLRFSLTGLPAGARAAFLPEYAKTGTSLLIATSAQMARGDYTMTVNAHDGNRFRSVSMILSVRTGADFSMSAVASSSSVGPGGTTTVTVNVTPLTSVATEVDITVAGLPAGSTVAPATSRTSQTAYFQLTLPSAVAAGTYRVTFTGVSGSYVRSAYVDITVLPTLFVQLSPSAASAPRGSTTSFAIIINSSSGTASPVLVVTALPPSSTANIVVNADGSRLLQVTTSAATPVGSYPVSISAYLGTTQVTTTATLTVT